MPGFLNQTRTLPDRRDLNRSFPGNADGSFTSRLAHRIFSDVLCASDYGLDLHTAGGDRANYPHIRADLNDPRVAELADAFGCELIIHGAGPEGTLRRAAVGAGVPTVVYEAGSARVFERPFIDAGLRGTLNVLRHLHMLPGEPVRPAALPPGQEEHLGARRNTAASSTSRSPSASRSAAARSCRSTPTRSAASATSSKRPPAASSSA